MDEQWLRILTGALGVLVAAFGIARSNAKAREHGADQNRAKAETAHQESSAARIGMEMAQRHALASDTKIEELEKQIESERAIMLREVEAANNLRRKAEERAHKAEERATQVALEMAEKFQVEGSGGGAQGRTGETGKIKKVTGPK